MFNDILITPDGYKFGNFEETVSQVLGHNENSHTLTKTGKIIVKILNTIDKNHTQKSLQK